MDPSLTTGKITGVIGRLALHKSKREIPASMKKITVAVVDPFGKNEAKDIDIDGDLKPDVNHNNLVCAYLKGDNPNIVIRQYGSEIKQEIDQLKKDIDTGVIDYMCVPEAVYVEYKGISRILGKKITPKNVAQNKEAIKTIKLSDPSNEYYEKTVLKTAQEKGIPIFTGSGNNNQKVEAYNFTSLYSITVGGTDKKGKNIEIDNSDVDIYAQARFTTKPLKDGIDVNEDGISDFSYKEVSAPKDKAKPVKIKGTSFSTPTALHEHLDNPFMLDIKTAFQN